MVVPRNLNNLSNEITKSHENIRVSEINDSCLRLAVNEGEFPWHFHANSDELFIVLEGELIIELLDRPPVTLKPHDIFLVPKKITHRTRANGRTVNLCIEKTEADTTFIN